jgi:hypothetical protein
LWFNNQQGAEMRNLLQLMGLLVAFFMMSKVSAKDVDRSPAIENHFVFVCEKESIDKTHKVGHNCLMQNGDRIDKVLFTSQANVVIEIESPKKH